MRRNLIALGAAGALLAVTAAGIAAPAPNAVNTYSGSCVVTKAGKMKGAVTVALTGSNLASSFLDLTGCTTPVTVVRRIARTGAQMPFNANGMQCTPSISGSTGKWRCVFQAADTPGKVTYTFTYKY